MLVFIGELRFAPPCCWPCFIDYLHACLVMSSVLFNIYLQPFELKFNNLEFDCSLF